MIPRSFSATSLQVAELCLARYKAEYIDYGKSIQGTAANVGIVCHGTFERFLRGVYITKEFVWDEDIFWSLFHEEYEKVFGANRTIPEYQDAYGLCDNWVHRDGLQAQLNKVKILSVESKNKFMMKTTEGEIPVNYIMDRLEKVGPTEYRIVDYKSNRVALTPAQMRRKIQPKLYALAVQILYKDATSIWVEFDFLRHGPVAIEFKREDNVATFKELKRATQRIIDTPATRIPETLNTECGWCVRKADCKTLQSHIAVGGVMGKELEELARIYKMLTDQMSGQKNLIEEIENQLLCHAIETDQLEYDLENATVRVVAKSRRKPDHELIATILGPKVANQVGSFRVADIDKLIKSKQVSDGQAMLLKAAMPLEPGDPTIKIEMKDV